MTQGTPQGFAGLASLVSNVDAVIAASQNVRSPRDNVANSGANTTTEAATPLSYNAQKPQGGQSSSFLAPVLWIGGILIVLVFLSTNSRTPKPRYASVPTAPEVAAHPESIAPLAEDTVSESAPLVGRGFALSAPQLRYCLSEGIRLDAARSIVETAQDNSIDRFNVLVDDYNSRCGSYRYSPTLYSRIEAQVQSARANLETEGRLRFRPPIPVPIEDLNPIDGAAFTHEPAPSRPEVEAPPLAAPPLSTEEPIPQVPANADTQVEVAPDYSSTQTSKPPAPSETEPTVPRGLK